MAERKLGGGMIMMMQQPLTSLVSFECTLRDGFFIARAGADLHCIVQSITRPWTVHSGCMYALKPCLSTHALRYSLLMSLAFGLAGVC